MKKLLFQRLLPLLLCMLFSIPVVFGQNQVAVKGTIVDQEGGQSVIFYQVDLELTDLQSHKKLWMGDKKIKKFISKDSVKL